MKTVVVGMSGGVDSSVAALLLKNQGYRVLGLFMKNWEGEGICTAEEDFKDAQKVASKLDIPLYSINLAKEYWDRVFKDFLKEYQSGRTPNPDVLCNREIKFDVFYEKAKKLGADYLATGHYCQTRSGKLLKGHDSQKDQSYFLHQVSSKVLKNVLFPIGHLEKSTVRGYAHKEGLITHNKKDSTGICFIGEQNFQNFLGHYLKEGPGPFKTRDGKNVGTHKGHPFYTLGQRKGLGLGGPGLPWYVVGKNPLENTVYVERGDSPYLYAQKVFVKNPFMINGSEITKKCKAHAKIRYRQEDQNCWVIPRKNFWEVKFDVPQKAMAIGQSLVLYKGNECLGGGIMTWTDQGVFSKNTGICV